MGKQSQLLLQPTRVELGLQVGVEFDKKLSVGSGCVDICKGWLEYMQNLN